MATLVGALVLKNQLPFQNPKFWTSLAELLLAGCFLGVLVSACMSCRDLALSIALYQSFLIIFTIVAGNAFYGELATIKLTDMIIFSSSVLAVILGLSTLTCLRPKEAFEKPKKSMRSVSEEEGDVEEELAGEGEGGGGESEQEREGEEQDAKSLLPSKE